MLGDENYAGFESAVEPELVQSRSKSLNMNSIRDGHLDGGEDQENLQSTGKAVLISYKSLINKGLF